jgi:protein-S-isoprenylcysteine O-methyltransferase Ste14
MKLIDIPPAWLAFFAGLAWLQSRYLSLGLDFGDGWARPVGTGLIALGLVIIGVAVLGMVRAKTSPVPHRDPDALVSTGLFGISRNPIYLADTLILTGLILRWDAVVSLILVPAFILLIEKRFILAEEQRLARAFPDEFAAYAARVRRWL